MPPTVPDSLTLAVVAALALLLVLQLMLKVRAIRHLRRPLPPLIEGADCPPALVILCLRGGDPFLHRSLGLLIDQDYPRYRIRVVVDSPGDEAHQYLRDVFGGSPPAHVEVLTLTERHPTCTYKMSGILFGTQEIPEGTACVALMDGDTVPHRSWLRELATPIVRDGAGVSTGNRWYAPQQLSLGSLCRVWWGASALSLMTLFRIPWGGTMAVRSDLLQDEELRTRLRHAYSEDTTIGQFAVDRGERIEFPPTLVIVNREVIGLRSLFQFDVRQLFAVRLTHHCWPWMALHGLVSSLVLSYPLWRQCCQSVSWEADVAFAVYIGAWGLSEVLQMVSIRRVLATRGERMAGWSEPKRWGYAILALLVLPCLHFIAVLHAATLRRVYWRGVWYRIGGQPPLRVDRDEWAEAAKT
jgi:Glycosyltransferase like family 2